ncbi:MAG TPA: DUF4062 domain-containing protein, partial [Anaerolineales bacterium]|nr:DUF4062 domain-containing protein [Anaerolineales bacterium]
MTKHIFVSSTSVDLGEYRKRVQDVIRQLGAIDISMENFGARDERPKDECLRMIKEESDLFVGIYAHRYGFIPKGDEKSITEQEYEVATLTKIPRFIYIVDDNVAWKPAFIDRGVPADKLKDFKERLKANHMCKFFTNEDQLASFVAADLGRYLSGIRISKGTESFDVSDSRFQITQDDLRKSLIVHAGRSVSVEKFALMRKLSLRTLEDDVTDEEIIEWFYLLPQTLSPFEETISKKSRIFINGQPLESPTPLDVY